MKTFKVEDLKLFRFFAEVFPEYPVEEDSESFYAFKTPSPVFSSNGKLVAMGVLSQSFDGGALYCTAAGRADFPERLEIELGEKYYLRASYEKTGQGLKINALYLSREKGESDETVRAISDD